MATDPIKQTVLNRDWIATQMARRMGPPAVDELRDLTKHDDRQIRILALTCIEEAGGPKAADAMVEPLLDGDVQVRATAVRGLYKFPNPALYARLLEQFDKSEDPHVRLNVPMIIALNDEKIVDQNPLIERYDKEEDEAAHEGLTVGLARLGYAPARREFVQRLHNSGGSVLDRYLSHCEYIHQDWVAKALSPVLRDPTKLRYIGPHGRDVNLRACDIAVNIIGKLLGRRFPFKTEPAVNYPDERLAEIRKFVDGLPE